MSDRIILEAELFGATHWAQWSSINRPRYEVYKYLGRNLDDGSYYFQRVTDLKMIVKGFHQLDKYGFVPFVLDCKRLSEYYQDIVGRDPNGGGSEPNPA